MPKGVLCVVFNIIITVIVLPLVVVELDQYNDFVQDGKV